MKSYIEVLSVRYDGMKVYIESNIYDGEYPVVQVMVNIYVDSERTWSKTVRKDSGYLSIEYNRVKNANEHIEILVRDRKGKLVREFIQIEPYGGEEDGK